MKSGRIELRHTFEGETNFVILRWFKTSTPLTQSLGYVTGTGLGAQDGTTVDQVFYPAPHSDQSLLIEDLDPVMYLVRAYRSLDGITPTEEILTLACDAGSRSQYSISRFEYVVDRGQSGTDPDWQDPLSNTIQLRDERLLNGTYDVVFRGVGPRGTDEFTDRSDDGGGFDLAVPDEVFESGQRIFVYLHNRVDSTDSGSGESGSGEVEGVVIIDEDTDFNASTMNAKLLFVDGPSATILVLSFANLSLLADCTFKISTHGGQQTYLTIQLDAGDTVDHRGEAKNAIHMGKAETMSFMIRNNALYILEDGTNYFRLGQRIWGDKLELNTLFRDGTQYLQEDQPRLMEYVESLPGDQVVSEATWSASSVITYTVQEGGANTTKTVYPNKGLFARDDVGGKIRVPDDRNMFERALKYVDGTTDAERELSKPGGYQVDRIISHAHKADNSNSQTGSGKFTTGGDAPEGGNLTTLSVGATETRGENHGFLPLIVI